jgi:hypothetical protein
MLRGEGTRPSMRQQMAQQHQQGTEQAHGGPYIVAQGGRPLQQHASGTTDHGRNTPPPQRNREDSNGQDYAALLQKHEDLRMFYWPSSLALFPFGAGLVPFGEA